MPFRRLLPDRLPLLLHVRHHALDMSEEDKPTVPEGASRNGGRTRTTSHASHSITRTCSSELSSGFLRLCASWKFGRRSPCHPTLQSRPTPLPDATQRISRPSRRRPTRRGSSPRASLSERASAEAGRSGEVSSMEGDGWRACTVTRSKASVSF